MHVVTDSTASLPEAVLPGDSASGGLVSGGSASEASAGRARLTVVPLEVTIGAGTYLEGVGLTPDEVAAHILAGRRLTTSQPSPRAFDAAYAYAAAAGATAILSVHLSGELSGTVHAAALAASRAAVPVRVVDSRTVAMGLGFAALAAAEDAAEGADLDRVARRAVRVANSSRTIFLVDSLDHLRRGGRLTATAAALGTVLGVRPLLAMRGGRIEVVQKVRTRAAAIERLVGVAAASVERRGEPEAAVHYLGDDDVARDVASQLTERTGVPALVTPVGAVLGAHVGPGVLAIVVADRAGEGVHETPV